MNWKLLLFLSSQVTIIKAWPKEGIGNCDQEEFECDSTFCIPSAEVCDGSIDCSNAEDEEDCDVPQIEGCPDGSFLVNQTCYIIGEEADTYEAANYGCRLNGWNLAKFNEDDFEELTYNLAETNISSFWLGATDILTEGNWVWQDASPVPLGTPFWALTYDGKTYEQEPSDNDAKNCLIMSGENFYHLSTASCDDVNTGLCSVIQVLITTEPTTGGPTTVPICSNGEFPCDSGYCLESQWVCDGQDDCLHGEDEADC